MIQTSGIFTGGGEGGKYKPYLTFRSAYPFIIGVDTPGWDGIVEVSTDAETWETWYGYSEISGTNAEDGYEYFYLRGTGNTTMMSSDVTDPTGFTIAGRSIYCIGSIEALLDYQTVGAGSHPAMGDGCFARLFQNCTGLVSAPELPAKILTPKCYTAMFFGCTGLIFAPQLPATQMATECYFAMFRGCTGLVGIPALVATSLADQCYFTMFYGCAKIKVSATKTDEYVLAYRIPFIGNTSEEGLFFPTSGMFGGTGGTFTGTESGVVDINTTYYVSNTNIVV